MNKALNFSLKLVQRRHFRDKTTGGRPKPIAGATHRCAGGWIGKETKGGRERGAMELRERE